MLKLCPGENQYEPVVRTDRDRAVVELRRDRSALPRIQAHQCACNRLGAGPITPMNEGSSEGELAAYYQEAASWDSDRNTRLARSAVLAWRVAAAATVCTMLLCSTLIAMLPLKRIEPFLIRVDSSNGVVDVVPQYVSTEHMPEAVTRYLITHYVSICERFNYATAESDYEECSAFHSAERNQIWYAQWNPNNPSSPLNVHKDGSAVTVQIQSVSFFTRAAGVSDVVQVRYLRRQAAAGGGGESVTHWIATIHYAYAPPSTNPKLRLWNPLGFKVLDFVSEPEVVHMDGGSASEARSRDAQ